LPNQRFAESDLKFLQKFNFTELSEYLKNGQISYIITRRGSDYAQQLPEIPLLIAMAERKTKESSNRSEIWQNLQHPRPLTRRPHFTPSILCNSVGLFIPSLSGCMRSHSNSVIKCYNHLPQ
jgi:hypothetical protein